MAYRKITDIGELRRLQLDILDEVHRFCTEHGITYFLSSGTLMGAVRHGGYIPWDDDIDLYMPRQNYERFVSEYHDASGRYRLLEPRLEKHYFYTFAKLSDTHTRMVEAWYDNFPIGINIDIFPVDYVTDCMPWRRFLFWWKKQLFRIYIDKQVRLLRDRHPWHIAKRLACRLIPISPRTINAWLRRIAHRRKPSLTVCNMTETGPSLHGCFSAEAIAGSVDIQFEGKTYKTMVGYHEYLQQTYGNYMALPPEEQRQHHLFEAYIQTDT